jgi:hypothetical protein
VMFRKQRIGLIPLMVLAVGCSTSKVTQTSYAHGNDQQGVKSIALLPDSGLLTDAIGIELSNRGYTVVEPQETATILGKAGSVTRANPGDLPVLSADSLAALRSKDVDAILIVRGTTSQDGRPQSATVRLTSTASGGTIAAVGWQNGWGCCVSGSPADRIMRKDAASAASEIADALVKNLHQ